MAKFIKLVSGVFTEESTVGTSAGAGDAGKVPHLNASGVLDSTIVNSKTTSAGPGDSGKIPALNASGILDDSILNASVTSSANKIVKMDGTGRIDIGVLPVGVGADTATITTSEALAAGDFVNVHNSSGPKVRKADATTAGKQAHGFVLASFGSGASAVVYFEGSNTSVTGKTPGATQFLGITAGAAVEVAPSAAGNVVQEIGVAVSATVINFSGQRPVTLV